MVSYFKNHKYHVYLLVAGFVFSGLTVFSAILTKQGVDPFNQVFWRVIFGTLFCLILAVFVFRQDLKVGRYEILLMVINSLWFIFGYTTFTGAIYAGAPLAKVVALNYAYPVPVLILSYLFLKEKPTLRSLAAVVISAISVTVLLELWKIHNLSQIGLGEFLAWVNSFAYAGIIVWGTKIRKSTNLNPFVTLFYTLLLSLPILLISVYILNSQGINFYLLRIKTVGLTLSNWANLILLALSSSVIPIALIYFAASKVKAQAASILLLTEVIWVYLLGYFLFGQSLSVWGILGGLGIMLSVILA